MRRIKSKTIAFIIILFLIVAALIIIFSFNLANKPICSGQNKTYIKNGNNCTINFLCPQDSVAFKDDCGCGCQLINASNRHYCTPESRNAQVCPEYYQQICGWFNSSACQGPFSCTAPYSNSCFACADQKIEYWTEGPCPLG